ncbi:hypothetical protein GCM10020367_11760 [Streptomyces sannanensis]|uniref:DUF1023 domain-containing protein n=1 Tax=Streptomyces sannanensis TaxID=285536 RepID=A0ABP6S6P3_9ACTN
MASRQRSPRSNRLRRTLLAALVAASVAVPVSGAARPAAVPAPAPPHRPRWGMPPSAALGTRYAASRDEIRAAERMADAHGDRRRAAVLRAMADPARRFLSFDGRDGGRIAEVFGDLAHAGRIAVLVPGSNTSLDTYERFRAGAVALRRELGDGAAVIAWLGYETPDTVSPEVLTAGRADEAAPRLRSAARELGTARPTARISLLCHSYGSVVCARAAPGLPVDVIVLYGSPGTGTRNAGALQTRAAVWAGRGTGDWIADVPHVRLRLPFATVGFGIDPVSEEYGAHTFDAGAADHSAMLASGVGFETLHTLLELVLSPLWFLLVFTALTAATPLVARVHPLWPLAVVLYVDLARFGLGGPEPASVLRSSGPPRSPSYLPQLPLGLPPEVPPLPFGTRAPLRLTRGSGIEKHHPLLGVRQRLEAELGVDAVRVVRRKQEAAQPAGREMVADRRYEGGTEPFAPGVPVDVDIAEVGEVGVVGDDTGVGDLFAGRRAVHTEVERGGDGPVQLLAGAADGPVGIGGQPVVDAVHIEPGGVGGELVCAEGRLVHAGSLPGRRPIVSGGCHDETPGLLDGAEFICGTAPMPGR